LTRDRLQDSFRTLRESLELTVMFVSHDMVEAILLADRIAVMDAGRILQIGTPAELLAAPAHPRVAELLESPRRQRDAMDRLLEGSP
ncbi:MAG: ABC transporter ATP-binding protein, partial [Deltaproteobacteria bacterium]|nr:ABC transporter ATP-binding protein [Deltaproteobacteria bacterium]